MPWVHDFRVLTFLFLVQAPHIEYNADSLQNHTRHQLTKPVDSNDFVMATPTFLGDFLCFLWKERGRRRIHGDLLENSREDKHAASVRKSVTFRSVLCISMHTCFLRCIFLFTFNVCRAYPHLKTLKTRYKLIQAHNTKKFLKPSKPITQESELLDMIES